MFRFLVYIRIVSGVCGVHDGGEEERKSGDSLHGKEEEGKKRELVTSRRAFKSAQFDAESIVSSS